MSPKTWGGYVRRGGPGASFWNAPGRQRTLPGRRREHADRRHPVLLMRLSVEGGGSVGRTAGACTAAVFGGSVASVVRLVISGACSAARQERVTPEAHKRIRPMHSRLAFVVRCLGLLGGCSLLLDFAGVVRAQPSAAATDLFVGDTSPVSELDETVLRRRQAKVNWRSRCRLNA